MSAGPGEAATEHELDRRSLTLLEEERDFLLASLEDLEREREAGDVDRHDYEALRDGYTARAAAVIRAIERREAPFMAAPPRSWRRVAFWVVVVVGFGALAGVLMAQSSGSRGSSDELSGDIRTSSRQLLVDAQEVAAGGDLAEAVSIYDEVLAMQPSNVEALTYRGWVRHRLGETDQAWLDLEEAVAVDPTYPDARVFRAILALDRGDHDAATEELDVLDTLDAPPMVRGLVESRRLRERARTGQVVDVLLGEDPPTLAASGFSADEVRTAAENLAEQARLQDALDLFNVVLAEHPDDARARAYKGWALARAGVETEHPEAVELGARELGRALETDPAQPDALAFRAFTRFYGLGDVEGAWADLQAFDRLDAPPEELVELIERNGLRDQITAELNGR